MRLSRQSVALVMTTILPTTRRKYTKNAKKLPKKTQNGRHRQTTKDTPCACTDAQHSHAVWHILHHTGTLCSTVSHAPSYHSGTSCVPSHGTVIKQHQLQSPHHITPTVLTLQFWVIGRQLLSVTTLLTCKIVHCML